MEDGGLSSNPTYKTYVRLQAIVTLQKHKKQAITEAFLKENNSVINSLVGRLIDTKRFDAEFVRGGSVVPESLASRGMTVEEKARIAAAAAAERAKQHAAAQLAISRKTRFGGRSARFRSRGTGFRSRRSAF